MKSLADIRQAFDASPVDIAVPPYPDDLAQFRLLFEPLHDDTITRLDGGRGDFHRMQDFPQPVFFRLRKVYVIHHLGKIVFPLFIAIEMPSFDDLPAVHDVDPVVFVDLIRSGIDPDRQGSAEVVGDDLRKPCGGVPIVMPEATAPLEFAISQERLDAVPSAVPVQVYPHSIIRKTTNEPSVSHIMHLLQTIPSHTQRIENRSHNPKKGRASDFLT